MKIKKSHFQYIFIYTLSGMLLTACATAGVQFSGKSATFDGDNILRNDVFSVIRKNEQYVHNCRDITSVNSTIDSVNEAEGLLHVKETWIVKACGKQHKYPVSLREDAQGETDFTVSIDPDN